MLVRFKVSRLKLSMPPDILSPRDQIFRSKNKRYQRRYLGSFAQVQPPSHLHLNAFNISTISSSRWHPHSLSSRRYDLCLAP